MSVSSQHFVGTLLRIATDHGFYPPILPGHPRITVGGSIGFDVHGKSGACFRSCLLELTVFHPTWGELRCSPENEAELFDLTVGGFGLTGFITSATLQLIPLAGRRIDRTRLPAANLLSAVELMECAAEDHDYVYSWNDLTRTDDAFGRGCVYAESIRAGDAPQPPSRDHALNPSLRSPIAERPARVATRADVTQ